MSIPSMPIQSAWQNILPADITLHLEVKGPVINASLQSSGYHKFFIWHVFFFSFLLEMIRCIWKGSHLGHHPERAHTQVRVHPLCRHCQGHCLDRGQQKDGCCWGRTWEVSLGVIPLQINSKPAVKWQCYTGFILVRQASFSRIIHMHLFSQGTLTSSHNPNVWALV